MWVAGWTPREWSYTGMETQFKNNNDFLPCFQLRGMGNRLDVWKIEVAGMETKLHDLANDFLNH